MNVIEMLIERSKSVRLSELMASLENPPRPRKLCSRPATTPRALFVSMQADMNRGQTDEELRIARRDIRAQINALRQQMMK